MQEVIQIIGLGIILTSWAILLTQVLQNKNEVTRQFIGIYLIGMIVLIIGGASRGLDFMAILNIAQTIVVTLLFLKLKKNHFL